MYKTHVQYDMCQFGHVYNEIMYCTTLFQEDSCSKWHVQSDKGQRSHVSNKNHVQYDTCRRGDVCKNIYGTIRVNRDPCPMNICTVATCQPEHVYDGHLYITICFNPERCTKNRYSTTQVNEDSGKIKVSTV